MLQVKEHISFAEKTSLGLGGHALAEISLFTERDFDALPAILEKIGGTPFVLGGGFNLLAHDGQRNVCLLSTHINVPLQIIEETKTHATIRIGAHCKLPLLVTKLAQLGLEGLAGLAGVPGTVGGALHMNAGSFEDEIGNNLYRMQIYSSSTGLQWIEQKNISFYYRKCVINQLTEWFIITQAEFRYKKGDSEEIKNTVKKNLHNKKIAQPIKSKSAGCLFKNPDTENPAGKLLELAGFKGYSLGGVKFSEQHANFLINTGSGTASQAFELIALAQEKIRAEFKIPLELEVITV